MLLYSSCAYGVCDLCVWGYKYCTYPLPIAKKTHPLTMLLQVINNQLTKAGIKKPTFAGENAAYFY